VTDSATFATPEAGDEDLGDLLLEVLPPDGSTLGIQSAREALSRAAERQISKEEYEAVKLWQWGPAVYCSLYAIPALWAEGALRLPALACPQR
jgi:hypothetical protein